MPIDLFVEADATFSPCRRWRYDLWRHWNDRPMLLWIMLNPSTADEFGNNDPTVERCERRTRLLTPRVGGDEYGGYYVCNIFALRSTDPGALYEAEDPVGPDNDAAILRRACEVDRVVCAWGNHGLLHSRGQAVLSMLEDAGVQPECLRVTGKSQPEHPLYISYSVQPKPWQF